jgi:hypothetical protein
VATKRRHRQNSKPITQAPRRERVWPFLLALAVLTLAVYWQAASFELTNYDDSGYITRNPPVLSGLNARSVNWAFTSYYQFNWHPLTWLSLMGDSQIAKRTHREPGPTSAGVYHITNVALHLANVLLLFLLLNRLIGTRPSTQLRMPSSWLSAFVAALFAIHPLHVESVAWVTERKDVLSTLFMLLAMLAYVAYIRKREEAGEGFGPEPRTAKDRQSSKSTAPTGLYLVAVTAFALGLLAKPMLVTLPILLLLLDYWPLGRFPETRHPTHNTKPVIFLIVEKIPLFALAAASCAMTIRAQSAGGAVTSLGLLPIGVRLANAAVSSVTYIGRMFWPANLAMFYPHPNRSLPEWQTALSVAVLVAITALVIVLRKRAPYLLVGWLWYVITLIPVSGIVQVGEIGMADRYTYVPLIGLFVMVVWGVADLAASKPVVARALAVAGAIAVVALAVCAHHQAGYWRNSIILWERTIEVTRRNPVAESNLADAFVKLKNYDRALPHLKRAVELRPNYANAHFGLGFVLSQKGQWAEAARHFRVAAESCPENANYHANLGVALANSGHADEGTAELQKAVEMEPGNPQFQQALDGVR